MLASRFLPKELGYLWSLSRSTASTRTSPASSSLLLRRAMLLPRPLLSSSLPPSTLALLRVSTSQRRYFHATPSRLALPFVLPLLAVLKTSVALGVATTALRVTATLLVFFKVFLAKHLGFEDPNSPRYMPRPPRGISWKAWRVHWRAYPGGRPGTGPRREPTVVEVLSPEVQKEVDALREWQERHIAMEDDTRGIRALAGTIFWAPILGLLLVFGAGLERVPLTGRWRIVLISPAEEEAIHSALKEKGWFEAVLDVLLTTDAVSEGEGKRTDVKILPETDWRWGWVESTLRRLEDGVARSEERLTTSSPPSDSPDSDDTLFPPPPPPTHPLHPRTRAAAFLHEHLPNPHSTPSTPSLSTEFPYQLLLLDSNEPNAFSYGFGGSGAAGIVVYRGLIDSILQDASSSPSPSQSATTPPLPPLQPSPPPPNPTTRRSLLSYFIPSPSSPPLPPPPPSSSPLPPTRPTQAQTLHLATVLSHEMSHLLLSHHLESLSHTSVVLPSLANLGLDLVRTILFPLTMVFGPFVNDAIATFTKPGDASKAIGDSCSSQKLEIEADVVGLRILAESSFNPFKAASFYTPERAPSPSHLDGLTSAREKEIKSSWTLSWFGASHPPDEVRAIAVQKELERWRTLWEKTKKKREKAKEKAKERERERAS